MAVLNSALAIFWTSRRLWNTLGVLGRAILGHLHAVLEAKPDEVMFGGSSASLSISSPAIIQEYELPFSSARISNLP